MNLFTVSQIIIVQLLCGLDDTQSKHAGQKWRKADPKFFLAPIDIRPKLGLPTFKIVPVHYAVIVRAVGVVGTLWPQVIVIMCHVIRSI